MRSKTQKSHYNMSQKLNKQKTIDKIIEKSETSPELAIDVEAFKEKAQQPDSENFIINIAFFMDLEPVYEK
jgi:hypothetical protein